MIKRILCFVGALAVMNSVAAQVTDRSGVKDVNGVVDNTPDSIA